MLPINLFFFTFAFPQNVIFPDVYKSFINLSGDYDVRSVFE